MYIRTARNGRGSKKIIPHDSALCVRLSGRTRTDVALDRKRNARSPNRIYISAVKNVRPRSDEKRIGGDDTIARRTCLSGLYVRSSIGIEFIALSRHRTLDRFIHCRQWKPCPVTMHVVSLFFPPPARPRPLARQNRRRRRSGLRHADFCHLTTAARGRLRTDSIKFICM